MAAAGRRRVVVEIVGQRIAVEVGGAEQVGGCQRLPRARQYIGAAHQIDHRRMVDIDMDFAPAALGVAVIVVEHLAISSTSRIH